MGYNGTAVVIIDWALYKILFSFGPFCTSNSHSSKIPPKKQLLRPRLRLHAATSPGGCHSWVYCIDVQTPVRFNPPLPPQKKLPYISGLGKLFQTRNKRRACCELSTAEVPTEVLLRIYTYTCRRHIYRRQMYRRQMYRRKFFYAYVFSCR